MAANRLPSKAHQQQVYPGLVKIQQDGCQRSHVESDIEGQSRVFPMEKPGDQGQVRGAANGQKLRDSLNDRQHYDLEEGHGTLR